jgi:putative transcriptional regulator
VVDKNILSEPFDRPHLFLAEVSVKNKLRELRATRQWSQSDLADHLGVSRQTINAIETEKYDPSLPLALKTARLFNTTVEHIFHLDSE